MIRTVSSSDPRFKKLTFTEGLNIIVADKTDKSTSRNTRNGSGKSSLVEIINFLLGSNLESDDIFKDPELESTFFSMEVDLTGGTVLASRKAGVNRIYLRHSSDVTLGVSLEHDDELDRDYLSLSKWKDLLGNSFFNLAPEVANSPKVNRPSFRSLLSYFVRRQADGGFADAEKHYKNQLTWDYQVNLSYLFDLDWRIAQEWQKIRATEKSIDALRSALKQGALGGEIIENAGKLRTQLTLAERGRDELRSRREQFHVAQDYEQLEGEASSLTQELNVLSDENTSDGLLMRDLQTSLSSEVPPEKIDVERVYASVGIELPGIAMRRFEEVSKFHESVILNRRKFLDIEIQEAERRITSRRARQRSIDERLGQIMAVLRSSGALDQFSALQDELSRSEASVSVMHEKFELARQLESGKADLDISRGRLLTRLQDDLEERAGAVKKAILTFESISEQLYEDPGSLIIEPTDNGPEFGTIIHAKRSRGKNNMQIFCFDLTLAILNSERKRMPGFLIHDSHLFDGADERQIGKALSIASEAAKKYGFQYIVTMNTDDLPNPNELPKGFNIKEYINPLQIDDTESGGLFGFRFG